MFLLDRETELTPQLLKKMIDRYNSEVLHKLEKYENYYQGKQLILKKSYADKSKPCTKAVVNFCKNIVDSYTGYMATPSFISYKSEHDIESIMEVLHYNDYQAEDNELLLNALIYGVSCELMYIDTEGKTRFKLINPTQCFGVYDDSLTNDLLYFVRIYKTNEWDDKDEYYVDVYSDSLIATYTMTGVTSTPVLIDVKPHYFSQCPANIFYMPDEKSVFDCVLGLQDAYNEVLNSEVDDYSAFCDSYLVLTGASFDEEEIASMKTNRVLDLPEGAVASWLVKQANDTQVENILKRIQESVYKISQCVDFSSESFTGGVSSGVAIQFKLSGMENRAGIIEASMKKALLRRIEIISGMAALKLGEELFTDIQIDFKRNIPADTTATITMINGLRGLISDATLLSQLDFVSDVNAELEAIAKQKEENMAMYDFGGGYNGTDDEAEEE